MIIKRSLLWFVPIVLIAVLITGLNLSTRSTAGHFRIEIERSELPADGHTHSVIQFTGEGGQIVRERAQIRIVEGFRRAEIESASVDGNTLNVEVRSGVLPGKVVVEVSAPNFVPARAGLETVMLTTDYFGDGTPDFLRLGPEDEEAFRKWFTFLAESQYYKPPERLAVEIDDCAALLRFAYREALREHDAQWANDLELDLVASFPAVRKYHYPFTPLGAGLFRIRTGSFRSTDTSDGTFAQFADAETLQRLNTHLVSRDINAARPGDLLFYRQLEQRMPFHAMIYLGPSHFEVGTDSWIVYHTGPIGKTKGEVRRPAIQTLLRHPEPQWRPLVSNSNFLGVYRWNVLR